MKVTFGVLAHVDAGKTTFSERVLFRAGVLKRVGRVDDGTSLLDGHPIERERGITVFSGQASFERNGIGFCLLDTPGHVDFSAEMERVLAVLDYAVLLVSGTDGVQSHTETVFRLLRQYRIPVFVFVNKMDRVNADRDGVFRDLRSRLTDRVMVLEEGAGNGLAEEIAVGDEALLEKYLDGSAVRRDFLESLQRQIKNGDVVPVFYGSALNGDGVDEFLNGFCELAVTHYEEEAWKPFSGRVFQVRYEGAERITWLKVLSGRLRVKDRIGEEKVDQLMVFSGGKRGTVPEVSAGGIAAVTGLGLPGPGDGIGGLSDRVDFCSLPVLRARVNFDSSVPVSEVVKAFQILTAEDPALTADWSDSGNVLHIAVMGKIQLEVLQEVLRQRFFLSVSFSPPEVLYKETISGETMGCGHFEPLRHYAEAILLLSSSERGSGVSFDSRCHVDVLPANFQSLIRTHVLEKVHKGVLTGSPLTDVKITLLQGRHHLKHTEGGDFREAVYRAVRQGLMKAESVLLEPWYRFVISAPELCTGRVMSDITRLSGSFEAPVIRGDRTEIAGKGPVSEFADYAAELAVFTRGMGTISLSPAGYEPCHNAAAVIAAKAYRPDGDTENPSCSVFCAKGTSFVVNWDEAERYMHCLK